MPAAGKTWSNWPAPQASARPCERTASTIDPPEWPELGNNRRVGSSRDQNQQPRGLRLGRSSWKETERRTKFSLGALLVTSKFNASAAHSFASARVAHPIQVLDCSSNALTSAKANRTLRPNRCALIICLRVAIDEGSCQLCSIAQRVQRGYETVYRNWCHFSSSPTTRAWRAPSPVRRER